VHSAGVARITLLIGRVWRLSRSSLHRGAPGEWQDDEERGKPSLPVHHFPPRRARSGEPISHNTKLRLLAPSFQFYRQTDREQLRGRPERTRRRRCSSPSPRPEGRAAGRGVRRRDRRVPRCGPGSAAGVQRLLPERPTLERCVEAYYRTAAGLRRMDPRWRLYRVRSRLAAGGKRIRTVGPIPMRARNAELALMSTAFSHPETAW
jgi:hypothetical protein